MWVVGFGLRTGCLRTVPLRVRAAAIHQALHSCSGGAALTICRASLLMDHRVWLPLLDSKFQSLPSKADSVESFTLLLQDMEDTDRHRALL